jgi:cobalt-precorrin-5B (C1)-methyltransferase
VDVARAGGLGHVAGCTGATSEATVQQLYGLPDHAMLDMGDFAGGLVKYLRRHPVARLTIGGGPGKLAKLAQGAVDLHSGRSEVDFGQLAEWLGDARLCEMNTVLQAIELLGKPLAEAIAVRARAQVLGWLDGAPVAVDVVVMDRAGTVLALAGP